MEWTKFRKFLILQLELAIYPETNINIDLKYTPKGLQKNENNTKGDKEQAKIN